MSYNISRLTNPSGPNPDPRPAGPVNPDPRPAGPMPNPDPRPAGPMPNPDPRPFGAMPGRAPSGVGYPSGPGYPPMSGSRPPTAQNSAQERGLRFFSNLASSLARDYTLCPLFLFPL